jgi:TolB-like protein/Tfp pilus assembly protein PilF
MGLVSELRRRNVLRMVVLYVVAAWLIMQVAEVLIGLAKLPDWVGTTTLGLLAVGFPIALIFSWFYELTPEGISLEKDIEPGESITHVTGRRIDFLVISLLCAGLILFAYDKWWIGPPPEKSIAVLPFVNMSDDPGNEYFSDGISEELLTLLARIPQLTVISRSSSFSFKDKDIDTLTIAQQLNVAHVLEGSVRKEENRVRITAQLIDARSDSHLWTETYDRTLDDIFDIQDDIATKVVEQLKVALGVGEQGATFRVQKPTESLEAYELFLRGRHLWRRRGEDNIRRAIDLFQKAIALDPQFARAWSRVAAAHITLSAYSDALWNEQSTQAVSNAQKALILDNSLADAHAVLADVTRWAGEWSEAEAHYMHAIGSEPKNSTAHVWYSEHLLTVGRIRDALEELLIAHQLDPLYGPVNGMLASTYWQLDDARNALKFGAAAWDLGNPLGLKAQLLVNLRLGEFDRAMEFAKQRDKYFHDVYDVPVSFETLLVEAKMDAAKMPLFLDTLAEHEAVMAEWILISGYARLGQIDDAYRVANISHDWAGHQGRLILWQPDMVTFRRDPRFAQLVAELGLLEYWREYGWPDACRPNGDSVICD